MVFTTYEIQSPALRPFIKYILFNYSNEPALSTAVTYYPNNDVCLGIIKGKQMASEQGGFVLKPSSSPFTSYLTGIYDSPHRLQVDGTFDEICLPFSPLGYFHFFRFSLKQYILQEDLLTEAFGKPALSLFERVFEEDDFGRRGALIEGFLQDCLIGFEDNFLKAALYYLESAGGLLPLKAVTEQLQCSEKKLQRSFMLHLGILPKEYAQILKFREALRLVSRNDGQSLTSLSYEAGYYDQSHFTKYIKRYTGKSPLDLKRSIRNLDQKVLFTQT